MGGKGDRFSDRSNLPWMPRHDRPQDEDAYVSLLSGAFYAPGADPEIRMLAEVMASMAPPPPADVPTEARPRRVRRAPLATTFGRRIAAVTAAGALGFGGFAAAAYAAALPASVQDIAHHLLGAPAGHHHGSGKNGHTPVGPPATGGRAVPTRGVASSAAPTHPAHPTPSAGRPTTTPTKANGGHTGQPSGQPATTSAPVPTPTPTPPSRTHGPPTSHRTG